jgi:Glycosyltransferase family 87
MPEVLFAALWLSLSCWGVLSFGRIWIMAMRPAPQQINDFYQDWGSARNHLVGLPVYTPHATSLPRHLGVRFDPLSSIGCNAHPPTSVLLALPLARLDYPDAVLVLNVISLAAFLVSLVIVAVALPVPRMLFLPILASLVFCHPLYANLHLGQYTPILVLLVTAIWALERSGRSGTAGLLVGAAAAIKLSPAYLAVFYLAQRQIRPLMTAALSFLALTLATVVVLGLDAYDDYVRIVLPEQAKFRSFGYNLSMAGLWYKLFDPVGETGLVEPLWPSPAMARWGTLLSDLAITVIVAMVVHRARTPARRDLAFALVVTAMLLVSPVTWDFSLPLLLVPIAVIARSAGKSQWMPAALLLVLTIDWIPQNTLTALAQAGRSFSVYSWMFVLGAPSLKFYTLIGTLVLGLAAFKVESDAEDGGPST